MRILTYFSLWLLFTNCSRHVTIRYTQQPIEIHSTESLTQLMLVNKSPRIVLRVPDYRKIADGDQSVTMSDKRWTSENIKSILEPRDEVPYTNTLLYNTIEKQLVREDFIVRDRNLFNDVLNKATSVNYSKMHGLTNTDLILEWINIDRQVGYNTNVCYKAKRNGREKAILLPANFRRLGASIEFKLIAVKTNEMVGTYRFHYTPCIKGCNYRYKSGRLEPSTSHVTTSPYEAIDQNELEAFVTDATRQLVKAIR